MGQQLYCDNADYSRSARPLAEGSADRLRSPGVVDVLGLVLLTAIIVTPIRVALYLEVGGAYLHVEEVLQLGLMALAAIRVFSGEWRGRRGELLSVGIIAGAIVGTQVATDRIPTSSVALQQARSFLPFVTAILVLLAPWSISRRTVVLAVCGGIATSATLASLIHSLFREHLQVMAVDHELLDIAIIGGRMYWSSLVSSILAPLVIIYSGRRSCCFAAVTMCVVLTAIVLSQSRSVLLGFGIATMFCFTIRGVAPRRVAVMVAILGVAGALMAAGLMAESEWELLWRRLGIHDFEGEFERAFELGRVPLYEQYWSAIAQAPISGLGLGHPVAFSPLGGAHYSADISVVHIMVPLGCVGGSALVWFVVVSARRACGGCRLDKGLRACVWMLLLAACMSLNQDPFFRSQFPIAFAFILSASSVRG
jgi:hypothetical protein